MENWLRWIVHWAFEGKEGYAWVLCGGRRNWVRKEAEEEALKERF
jgi:hypothetical protein